MTKAPEDIRNIMVIARNQTADRQTGGVIARSSVPIKYRDGTTKQSLLWWGSGRWLGIGFFVYVIFVWPVFVFAQPVEEIESEVDMDNARYVDPSGAAVRPEAGVFNPADKAQTEATEPEAIELKEQTLIKTSRTLRRLIEQNKQLVAERDELDERLRNLRGQRSIELNKMNTVMVERDAYKQQNQTLAGIAQRDREEMRELKEQLRQKDAQLQATAKAMAEEMAKDLARETAAEQELPQLPAPAARSSKTAAAPGSVPAAVARTAPDAQKVGSSEPLTTVLDSQARSIEVLDMVDQLAARNAKLKADQARVHYNMGNIYYRQSEYRRAIREYRRALALMPKDHNAHFNLAFVSGEYLHDYATALRHYKEYLMLNPGAPDTGLVQEKILEAELQLKARVDSTLEKDLKKRAREVEVYVQ